MAVESRGGDPSVPRPVLGERERLTLMRACADHVVATCPTCRRGFRYVELASDLITDRRFQFCPLCRADVTPSLLGHIGTCPNFVPSKPPTKIEPGCPPASSSGTP